MASWNFSFFLCSWPQALILSKTSLHKSLKQEFVFPDSRLRLCLQLASILVSRNCFKRSRANMHALKVKLRTGGLNFLELIHRLMRLTLCIAVCLGAGWLSSLLTRPALTPWYEGLAKPHWTPPNWLFAPVWMILYVTMGFAAWLVWRRTSLKTVPMQFFLVQLLMNVGWSAVFFRLHSPGFAFLEIVALWCAILLTVIAFGKTVPAAGWLMLPYWLWVSYAAALNFAIWRLNF